MCLCLNECAYIIFFSLFLVQNCQYHPNTHFNLFGLDPYLNTDAGTMSPFEHGEVFVLDDGGEVHREISSLFIYCCTLENISVFPFFFFQGGCIFLTIKSIFYLCPCIYFVLDQLPGLLHFTSFIIMKSLSLKS